jgi:hypothetical protein
MFFQLYFEYITLNNLKFGQAQLAIQREKKNPRPTKSQITVRSMLN